MLISSHVPNVNIVSYAQFEYRLCCLCCLSCAQCEYWLFAQFEYCICVYLFLSLHNISLSFLHLLTLYSYLPLDSLYIDDFLLTYRNYLKPPALFDKLYDRFTYKGFIVVDDKEKAEKEKKKKDDDTLRIYDKDTASIIRVRYEGIGGL